MRANTCIVAAQAAVNAHRARILALSEAGADITEATSQFIVIQKKLVLLRRLRDVVLAQVEDEA